MQVKIWSRKPDERRGIACLPLAENVPVPRAKDWKRVNCPVCGAECWESDLARQVIAAGTAAACINCALKDEFGR